MSTARHREIADPAASDEARGYLSNQLTTCIGNKRALLAPIRGALEKARRRLGRRYLRLFDPFSGSGVVSRLMKGFAARLVSNDLEDYAALLGRCYLANASEVGLSEVARAVDELNRRVAQARLDPGFIRQMYSPADADDIRPGERVFYSPENARRLDDYRRYISSYPPSMQDLLLGPLVGAASVHVNTAGVFKGFYKDRATGVGRFGGTGGDALPRIMGRIELQTPILSARECDVEVHREDANLLVDRVGGFDLAYVDPPYNQHPYGSNYFMLNLLVTYERPHDVSRVSGIPKGWRRSRYNVRRFARSELTSLLSRIDAPILLLASNDEGFLGFDEMSGLLSELGRVEVLETKYPAFRGSRSFERRPIHVTERLFWVERA